MKRTKRIRIIARQLYRLCLVNGLLDAGRVHQVVQRLSGSRSRNRLGILLQFHQLVKLDRARHTATVESAEPLSPGLQSGIRAGLARVYGPGLDTSFTHTPALIGGMRIQVGSDVYDGSVRARLSALAARF